MRLKIVIHRMKPIIVSTTPRTGEFQCSKIGRRQSLKHFLLVTGALITEVVFTQSATAVSSNSGVLRINVSSLVALIPVGGSVLVTYDAGATQLLINRASAGNFHVPNPTCTHAGCTVGLYVAANQGISCPCHGSFFGISGQVLNGPANRPLDAYQSSFDGDDVLSVTVPGLQFYIDSVQLDSENPAGRRLKLSFPTHSFASYSIQRTNHLTDAPQRTTFATTATGPANETTLLGSGERMSVWVDASHSSGFFTLSLQLYEVS